MNTWTPLSEKVRDEMLRSCFRGPIRVKYGNQVREHVFGQTRSGIFIHEHVWENVFEMRVG